MAFVTLDEVIRFAVKKEEEAFQLYKTAAGMSTSIAARKMFESMAAEEARHKEVFGQMSVEKAQQYKAVTIPAMNIDKYLVDVELQPNLNYQQILIFAMKAEENAFQLYTAAADAAQDPELEKVLRVFADVEKGHKVKVEQLYEEHVLTEG
ncbi:ferritin [Desulfuromonas versatilis]|uniref:Ferritin n=1 Tax=Desulfuromonas versatilis TaxID=2802975 RepID=A0ABM8HYG4_9BACT|nr:ferritin family protein [Desulfuromonas versatilis]BCR06152.1 ferritin [Desulfuromonas versatilis]